MPGQGLKAAGSWNLITCLDRASRLQEVGIPESVDNRYMNVINLSAIRTGCLYLTVETPFTLFS